MPEFQLRLVLVTPEQTLLDVPVQELRFPLYDGQIGILPGRAPLVGRLGTGELLIVEASQERRYFIDGGFAQVKGPVVSLLTNRAMPVEEIRLADAQAQLDEAMNRPATSDEQLDQRQRDQDRARRLVAMASR